jgi:hypothetical protein
MRDHTIRIAVPLLLAFALTGAACTSDSTDTVGTPLPTAASATSAASPGDLPSDTGSPTPTSTPVLEDGRSFVYVKSVDAGLPSLTFDLAYFYSGEEANQIAGERGDEVPVPNDVYIVNDNPKLRTLPFAADAEVLVYDWHECCDTYTPITVDRWAAYVDAPTRRFHGSTSPYWLTVRDGEIVKAQEQYLP